MVAYYGKPPSPFHTELGSVDTEAVELNLFNALKIFLIELSNFNSIPLGDRMILRENYLNRIRPFYDSPLIKIIVGVRRCGKSVLLRQIADEIRRQDARADSIIFVDLDDYANREFLDPDRLFSFITEKLEGLDGQKAYLFFDEIQNVRNFELVVNSLNNTGRASIFLTGSNSKLLSGELATKLGGRTLAFRMMPFNFREFLQFKEDELHSGAYGGHLDPSGLLPHYLQWGGFPLVCDQKDDESRRVVLDNLYSSIVLRDIIQRSKTSSPVTLENVLDYLIANSSTTISGNNIAAALSDSARKVSAPTVYDLLKSIEDSYIVSKVERFDIRGKKILSFEAKEYVCDLGFFHVRKNRVKDEWNCVMETAVYNELLSRGMRVYIGKTYKGEIDFIAECDGKRCYLQVAYLMADEDTREREFGAFRAIGDEYPKYVISMDPLTMSRDGITHLRFVDFLTNENLLTLG